MMHSGLMSVFIALLLGAAYGWILALCVKVMRNSSQVGQLQGNYQAQYMQYMQQMQANQAAYNAAYGQSAYNAPAAPPPQGSTGQTGWQWQAPPPPPPGGAPAPFLPPEKPGERQE